MTKTQRIVYVNNYDHKNTAALRRAYKKNLCDLKFDRDHSSLKNVKIYKVYSKKSGHLVAEFHIEGLI